VGYFISRLNANANPKILFPHRSHKDRKKPIEARSSRVFLHDRKKDNRRSDRGNCEQKRVQRHDSKVAKSFRLVGIFDDEYSGKLYLSGLVISGIMSALVRAPGAALNK